MKKVKINENSQNLFPYDRFPFRLEYKEGKSNKVCWFDCQDNLNKYIDRHKLKKKEYTTGYKYAEN